MKKIIAVILSVLMLLAFPVAAYADVENDTTSTTVEYLEDGSYIMTTVEEETSLFRASTKTGSKTATFYNSDDEVQWIVKITGTFSYTGSSATCTRSTATYTIYDSSWKVTSYSATKSGRTATGKFTLKQYLTLIPIRTENRTVTLSCSNSGTLS